MPQSIDVALNGEPLGQLSPASGWGQSSLLVPRQRLRSGSNLLIFDYQRVAIPRDVDDSPDDRQLAVLFDALDLVPLSNQLAFEMGASDRSWSFLHGWSDLELIDDRSVRWNDGTESALRFRVRPVTGRDYRLTLSAMPYGPTMPQSLKVSLNGIVLYTLTLAEGWREYALTVPEGLLRAEENELRFEYRSTLRPRDILDSPDTRHLAVLFDAVRLSPLARPRDLLPAPW